MSEPTIKPVGCLKCGWPRGDTLPGGTFRCFGCGGDSSSLYTHVDLVAVAREVLADQSAVFDAESERIAEAIVERLTGVKR